MADPLDARLYLLSLFRRPRSTSSITMPGWREHWRSELGAEPEAVIRDLLATGHLDRASIVEALACKHDVPTIKDALRSRGLKVSGRKMELAERLHGADLVCSQKMVEGATVLVCTEAGHFMAAQYEAQREMMRGMAEAKILAALARRQFERAANAAYDFNRSWVFAPGPGFSPEGALDVARDQLPLLYGGGLPAIVGPVASVDADHLLAVAALRLLGFHDAVARSVSGDANISPRLADDVAVRMCMFAALHRRNQMQMTQAGCTHAEIGCCSDACPECAAISGRAYRIAELPELPLANCTSEAGCRCRAKAVL